MTEVENSILTKLIELEEKIALMPTAVPKPNLMPLFSELDELTRQLPKNAPPDLLHYLHKKSYQKARLFLEGRQSENQAGNCRHV